MEEVFCLCREPYDENRFMIACDTCNEWYHLECIGLSEREGKILARATKPYLCPICKKNKKEQQQQQQPQKSQETINEQGTEGDHSPKKCSRRGCRRTSQLDSPYCDECIVIHAKDVLKRIAAKKNVKTDKNHEDVDPIEKSKRSALEKPRPDEEIRKSEKKLGKTLNKVSYLSNDHHLHNSNNSMIELRL